MEYLGALQMALETYIKATELLCLPYRFLNRAAGLSSTSDKESGMNGEQESLVWKEHAQKNWREFDQKPLDLFVIKKLTFKPKIITQSDSTVNTNTSSFRWQFMLQWERWVNWTGQIAL